MTVLVLATAGAPLTEAAAPTPVGPDGPTGPTPSPPSTPSGSETPTPTPEAPPTSNGTVVRNGTKSDGGGGGWLSGAGNAVASGVLDALRVVGVEQPVAAVGNLTVQGLQLAASTPHANNAGNWFRAPTNAGWGELWDVYKEFGEPLYWTLVAVGLVLGLGMAGAGYLSRAEIVEWRRKWMSGAVGGMFAWEFGNLYLLFIDGLKTALVTTPAIESPLSALVTSGAVLAILLVVASSTLVGAFALVAIVLMSAFGGMVGLPFLPALLAARGVPLRFIHGPATTGSRTWAILPLISLPMAVCLSFALTMDPVALFTGGEYMGALVVAGMYLAGIGLSIISPYIIWSGISSTGAGLVGYGVGSHLTSQKYEQMKDGARRVGRNGKQAATGARDATRGARGKAPVSDGGRGYDIGQAARQTGSGLRPSTSPSGGVRDRLRRASGRSSTTSDDGLSEIVAQNDRTTTLADLTNDDKT